MEGCRSNHNGDVELALSFSMQLESPKTEFGCKSYDQNGEEAEICFSAKLGSSVWRPVYTGLCTRGGRYGSRKLPGGVPGVGFRQEQVRDTILAEKLEPKHQIGGGKRWN